MRTFRQLLKRALLAQTTLCSVNFCGIFADMGSKLLSGTSDFLHLQNARDDLDLALVSPLQGKPLEPLAK